MLSVAPTAEAGENLGAPVFLEVSTEEEPHRGRGEARARSLGAGLKSGGPRSWALEFYL